MDSGILGKWLILGGVVLLLVGVFLIFGPKLPWFGRLPGDIFIQRERFTFYFPVVTCLVLSIVISLLLQVFKK